MNGYIDVYYKTTANGARKKEVSTFWRVVERNEKKSES